MKSIKKPIKKNCETSKKERVRKSNRVDEYNQSILYACMKIAQ
jgi:hypothetical protein